MQYSLWPSLLDLFSEQEATFQITPAVSGSLNDVYTVR